MAKVTRTYVQKKTGKVVTKTYEYANKPKVNKLTTKKGTLTKNASKILDEALQDASFVKIDYIKSTIELYQTNKKVLTLAQVNAMFEENKLAIFLANMQISVDDISKQLKLEGINVDVNWLLDESHWIFHRDDDADINLPNGEIAYFVFNYNEHTYDIEVY